MVSVKAENNLIKGGVTLTKVDDVEENVTLEGAVFKIADDEKAIHSTKLKNRIRWKVNR